MLLFIIIVFTFRVLNMTMYQSEYCGRTVGFDLVVIRWLLSVVLNRVKQVSVQLWPHCTVYVSSCPLCIPFCCYMWNRNFY